LVVVITGRAMTAVSLNKISLQDHSASPIYSTRPDVTRLPGFGRKSGVTYSMAEQMAALRQISLTCGLL
jgi:hypothetical protein